MKLTLSALLALLLSVISTSLRAEGALMVLPTSIALSGHQPRTITVRNTGDEPMYLKVDVVNITNPGEKNERRIALSDLDSPGIIVNPAKLTLGANQSRKITVTPLKGADKETVYRIYIVPVKSYQVENTTKNKISAPVSLSIGYGVLLRHQPDIGNQVLSWQASCSPQGMTLSNTGNVRVLFRQVKAAGKPVDDIALFPGTPLSLAMKVFTAQMNNQLVTVKCH